jgi:hypothetical protein
VEVELGQVTSIRLDENGIVRTPPLDGALGAVESELEAVVKLTVRIGEWLFSASRAITPNWYAVPLLRFTAWWLEDPSVVAI